MKNTQMPFITVNVDEGEVKELCNQKILELVKEADVEFVFWDRKELMKRTCMSWDSIQEKFFSDPRFIKRKIGQKWYFPARETREFLVKWLEEQVY
ncbi:group-specific protein [Chengkuizengella sp. SCS-71B]|uniref:group-specific protein n=1 Tax=Chengkuizengella sp. SCS-71B TaxID=3115290 RepID=UPI0032C21DD3